MAVTHFRLMTLYIDVRHKGTHGIARYASEVTQRLTIEWNEFEPKLSPSSPLDAVSPKRLTLSPLSTLYNPGFNTGPARCRQVLTLHDLIHLDESSPRGIARRVYYERVVKPVVIRTGRVFTVSDTSAEEISNWLMNDYVSIVVTGNGCSAAFKPQGAGRQEESYFLYVGTNKPHKNLRLALEAIRLLTDRRLLIVTPQPTDIQQAAREVGVLDRVTIIRPVPDQELAALYAGAAALAFPSIKEGFGLPVLEALRCRTNIVYCNSARAVSQICRGGHFSVSDHRNASLFAEALTAAASADFEEVPGLDEHDWNSVSGRIDKALHEIV